MARLGAYVSDYLGAVDLDTYVGECVDRGLRSAPCPITDPDDSDAIAEVRREFAAADLVVSETAAWVNPLDPDPTLRREAIQTIVRALALAEEVRAACCTTVSGSFATADMPDSHVGQHPANFEPDALDAVVEWIGSVLTEVKPKRTYLTLEMCPWAVVDQPGVYRTVLERVDQPGLAVHLDPANHMVSPRALFDSGAVIRDLFEQLGPWVKACHAKDVTFVGSPSVVQMMEVPPGNGFLDYVTFLRCVGSLGPDLPLILEHLPDRETYSASADHIRSVAAEVDVAL